MPWTAQQRKYFHHLAENPADAREAGMTPRTADRLASEADDLKRRDKEKPPVRKAENFIDLTSIFGHPDAT